MKDTQKNLENKIKNFNLNIDQIFIYFKNSNQARNLFRTPNKYYINLLDMQHLPEQALNDLWNAVSGGNITIINHSDQLIKAKVDATYPPFENSNEFHIHPGSSEKWSRASQEVVRICAYSLWHDFKLSPGAVVKLTPDFFLQIVDGHNNGYQWNARVDGPHI